MKKKHLYEQLDDKKFREQIVHNILKNFTEEKRPDLTEYVYEDGFWVFADSQESADKKHLEWLDKNK